TRRDLWRLISSTQLNDRTLFFTSSSIEECEQLAERYGVISQGRLVAIGTVEALRVRHTRLCILQLEVEDKYAKQR
ncbi:hypothetical protein TELCIR_24562, partial [Teladorsagia circumcincta]